MKWISDFFEMSGLPFESPITAAKIFLTVGILLIAYIIVRAVVFSRSLTLHRAPAAVAFA